MTATQRPTRSFPAVARWRQFTSSLLCRPDRRIDDDIRRLLGEEAQWMLVARLPAFDRRHLLDVHNHLVAAGYTDPDLLRAALLHDVGKADGHGKVGTLHRVLRVLLRRLHPEIARRLANGLPVSYGLFLAENHATLGAMAARAAGVSERCCRYIELHECGIDSADDPMLIALIAADEGISIL